MFWILFGLFLAAEGAKLDKTYLAPTGAKESGGHDSDLQLPLEPPYIDPYSPQPQAKANSHYRPATRRSGAAGKHVNSISRDDQMLENEDEIVIPTPMLGKGRFISGSYSYTGPDNVLVTVTYKADKSEVSKDDANDDVNDDANQEAEAEDDKYNYEEEEQDEDTSRTLTQDVAEQEQDDADSTEEGVIPTPPSLPAELARAFDFHRRKQQREEEKTQQKPSKNKKPFHGLHGHNKNKGSHGAAGHRQQNKPSSNHQQGNSGHYQQDVNGANTGNFGMKTNPTSGQQGAYHYGPQNTYLPPVPPTINQGYSNYARHN